MPTLILLEQRLDPRTGFTRSIGSEIELDEKRAELMVSYGQAKYKGDDKRTAAVVASARAQDYAQSQRSTKPKPTAKTTDEIVNLALEQKIVDLIIADDTSGNDVPAFNSIYQLNDWMAENDLATKSKIGKKTKALIEISVTNWIKANPKAKPAPADAIFSDDDDEDEDEEDGSLDTLLGDDDDLSDL